MGFNPRAREGRDCGQDNSIEISKKALSNREPGGGVSLSLLFPINFRMSKKLGKTCYAFPEKKLLLSERLGFAQRVK
jgi:hypothetical protein